MMDWTFDKFFEDSKMYKATPIKGVHCSATATDREQFMVWFKNTARDFKGQWLKSHTGLWDRYDGYIGDAFARELDTMNFSDIYKETYGQRPHLADWYYVHVIGFPTDEDVIRTFCETPIEDAVDCARRIREEIQ